jgi:hypothetical protein
MALRLSAKKKKETLPAVPKKVIEEFLASPKPALHLSRRLCVLKTDTETSLSNHLQKQSDKLSGQMSSHILT